MFSSVRTLLLGGLIGKVLAIVRELVSASLFGTGYIAAAYRLSQAAFIIPLNGLVSDAVMSGFIPTYARARGQGSEGRELFAAMHAILLVFSLALAAVVAMGANHWIAALAPGLDSSTRALAVWMVRVLAIAMPAYALTGLYAATELAVGTADMAASRASVQSLGLVVGTILAWLFRAPVLIAAGFVLGYLSLSTWGLLLALRHGRALWPNSQQWRTAMPQLKQVGRAFGVIMWVPILMQVHFIVERRVASQVSLPAVAAIDYARFISDTAVLLLAVPFALAGLGPMSHMSAADFRSNALRSSRMLLYVGVPISSVLFTHSQWIVRIVYGHGAFGTTSVTTTAAILAGFGGGLWAQLIGYAGVKFLNARGKNFVVVRLYVLSLAINVSLNLFFQRQLGAAVLGVGAGLGSVALGLSVLSALGIVRALWADLVLLLLAGIVYSIAYALTPLRLTTQLWFPVLFLIVYWTVFLLVSSRTRSAAADIWILIRPSKMATQ